MFGIICQSVGTQTLEIVRGEWETVEAAQDSIKLYFEAMKGYNFMAGAELETEDNQARILTRHGSMVLTIIPTFDL
jgi:hypothetical protein